MQRIDSDILNKQFKRIYLLYGEERYLLQQYKNKLFDAISLGDTMNAHKFQGKDVSVAEIIDLAETLPFFAERRVILLEDTELVKSGGDTLAEYAESIPESTVIILAEEKVDKRTKLFKAAEKNGLAVELSRLRPEMMQKWVVQKLRRENKQMSRETYEYFMEMVGDDMSNINTELEKLFCYCLDREVITNSDIDAVCVRQIQTRVFDMIDALAEQNQGKALALYYDMLATKEPPMRILSLIGRQFHMLLVTKEMMSKGSDKNDIAKVLGVPGFVAGKYMSRARAFSGSRLKEALQDVAETDYSIKTGKITDMMGVELLLVQYSRRPEKKQGT